MPPSPSATTLRHPRAALLVLLLTLLGCAAEPSSTPRAVILCIGDGLGPAQVTLTRNLLYGPGERLTLETLPVSALMTTYSASNPVTDSAAAGTAMASGVKTTNSYLGWDVDERELPTLADRAREEGWSVGYVTTSRITHATPAAFYAHGIRYAEEEIASQLLDERPDLALGGGADLFLPETAGGGRADGENLVERARRLGYTVWREAEAVNRFLEDRDGRPERILGLFAPGHLRLQLDEDHLPAAERHPHLATMTRTALAFLGEKEAPFLLLVEGGRIDHASHAFDAPGTARETRAFDRAIAEVLAFAEGRDDVLVLVTADHATGGLAINDYVDWEALERQRASVAWLAEAIRERGAGAELLSEMTGYGDWSAAEIAAVRAEEDRYEAERALGAALARRHGVTWIPRVDPDATDGHTGEDVALYAAGPGAERFQGVLDNTDIHRLVSELTGWE